MQHQLYNLQICRVKNPPLEGREAGLGLAGVSLGCDGLCYASTYVPPIKKQPQQGCFLSFYLKMQNSSKQKIISV